MFWWCGEAARAVDWWGDCVAWCLCEDWCCTVTVTVTSSEEEEGPLRRPSLTAHTHHRSSPSPSDSSSPSPLPSSLRESIFWRQSTHILKDHFLLSELFVQYLVFGDLQKKKTRTTTATRNNFQSEDWFINTKVHKSDILTFRYFLIITNSYQSKQLYEVSLKSC